MARLASAVFAGLPHHLAQRGNGRTQTFFGDADYALYRDLLAEHVRAAGGSREGKRPVAGAGQASGRAREPSQVLSAVSP